MGEQRGAPVQRSAAVHRRERRTPARAALRAHGCRWRRSSACPRDRRPPAPPPAPRRAASSRAPTSSSARCRRRRSFTLSWPPMARTTWERRAPRRCASGCLKQEAGREGGRLAGRRQRAEDLALRSELPRGLPQRAAAAARCVVAARAPSAPVPCPAPPAPPCPAAANQPGVHV